MRKYLAITIIIFSACSPTTIITGSWKSPSSKEIKSILVANLTSNTIVKSTVEKDFAEQLNHRGVLTYSAIDMFPPDVSNSDSNLVNIMQKVKGKKMDAILTITLLHTETESRYVDRYGPYDPSAKYGYYRDFPSYYSYWYPYSYNPEYNAQKIYYIETNLYDVNSEKLLWSTQSKAYDIGTLEKRSKKFAETIIAKLVADNLIK